MALLFPQARVPAGDSLGIRIDGHVLAYTVAGGLTRKVECAVVVAADGAAFLPGDILVSCNDRPLINCPLAPGMSMLSTVQAALTEAAQGARTVVALRSKDTNGTYDPAYNTTIVSMTAHEAAAIFDDAALQQQHEDERRRFEAQPATAQLLSVTIPYEQPSLGLEIQVQRLTYVNDQGKKVPLDCCVVLNSLFSTDIMPGDLVVKVNYNSVVSDRRALCRSDTDSRAFFDDFMAVVNSAERPLKLGCLRLSAGVGRQGLSPRLLVRLPRALEDAVFTSTPLNVLSEDEEIARRVEEQMYRLQKVRSVLCARTVGGPLECPLTTPSHPPYCRKRTSARASRSSVGSTRQSCARPRKPPKPAASKKRSSDAWRRKNAASPTSCSVPRYVETWPRGVHPSVSDAWRGCGCGCAQEEARRLEEEAERIAQELKKVEDDERAKRVAEEVQKRVEQQQRQAAADEERRRFEEAVQARAREKARDLLGDAWSPGTAGPSRHALVEQEADRRALVEVRTAPPDPPTTAHATAT